MEQDNTVFKPDYYKAGDMDVIAFAQHHNLGFCEFTIVKYLTRAGKKPGEDKLKDLKKCEVYLKRLIEFEEKK